MLPYIEKVSMKGFKSFSNSTKIEFDPGFSVIVGPNGSGKCIVGDSLVQLKDGSLIKIKELVNKKIRKNKTKKLDDGIMAYGEDTEVLCLDTEELKTAKGKVTAFVKRKAPENLLKIKTRSGREITATEYHPLFVLDEGNLRSIKAEELKEGKKIAVPRKVPIENKTKYFIELLDLIEAEDKIYVPYNTKFIEILRDIKGNRNWKELASEIGIPLNSIRGLRDKQSINFAYLVKLLRFAGLEDKSIIEQIPKVKSKNGSILYNMPWKNSKEFARFFGYLLAEGRMPVNEGQIWFTNNQKNIIKDYHHLISSIFGLRATINEYTPNCWDVLTYSTPVRKILNKFGMSFGGTEGKKINNVFLSHSTNEELWALLDGLFSGDGYVSKSSIEIITKSTDLAFCLKNILLRLGITFTSSDKTKRATNSNFTGSYKKINVYGVDNLKKFYKKTGFTHRKKQSRLEKLINVKSNPNLDLVKVNSLVKKVANELEINIKRTKKDYPKLDAYCYNQCTPSRDGLRELVDNLFTPLLSNSKASSSLPLLRLHSNSDIFWDEIISIEKVEPPEEWVYDLCVEKNHNFIANNFFVHNSNILDALCFTLGRLSTKSLRADNYSELISRNLSKKKKGGKASITLHNDESFPVDSEKLKIERNIKPSGGTKYKLNGKKTTRKNILNILSRARIMPEGHNIILQGDVNQLVDMTPTERRELIEEVAGIVIYEQRKEKTEKELEKVNEKLKDAQIVLREKENYMENLESEKEEAEKYQDTIEKLKRNKYTLFKLKVETNKKKRKKIENRIESTNKEIENLEEKSSSTKEEISKLREKLSSLEDKIEELGGGKRLSLQKEIEELKVKLEKSKNLEENSERELKKIANRKKQLNANLGEINKKIKTEEKKVKKLKEEKKKLVKKEKKKRKNISEEETDKLEEEIEKKEQKIEGLKDKKLSLQEKLHSLQSDIDKTEYRLEDVKNKLDEKSEKSSDIKSQKKRYKEIVQNIGKLVHKDSKLASQIGDIKKKIMKMEEELGEIRVENKSRKKYLLRDKAIKNILSAKEKDSIKGIHGTAIDLGTVEEEYSQALKVAAGSRLKNIVVDDTQTAIKCLNRLKRTKSGTATFLPLTKIKSYSSINPPNKEGVIDLAHNLVRCNSKYNSIFKYIFGNTVIVEDIDTAKNVGIGNYRMVTLEGDVFNKSGSVRGGYRSKKTGVGFKTKDLSDKIEKVSGKLNNLKNKRENKEDERKKLEKKLEELRKEKAILEGKIESYEEDSDKNWEDQKEELSKKLSELESQKEKIEKKLSEIENKIESEEEKLSSKKDKRKEQRESGAKKELEEIKEKRREKESKIAQSKSILNNTLKPEKENILRVIKELGKEKESFENQIESEKENREEIKKKLAKKEEKESSFYAKLKDTFKEKDKVNDKIRERENKVEEISQKISKKNKKKNKLSVKKAKKKAELEGIKEELEEFKNVEEVEEDSISTIQKRVSRLEKKMEGFGQINMKALEKWKELKEEFDNLSWRVGKLDSEREDIQEVIKKIEKKKKEIFLNTFKEINKKFKEIFAKISPYTGKMKLEKKRKPFEGGVRINVENENDKKVPIASLSGGEKVLTALALIFSIQELEPAPFYLLDEVDAALDKVNSEKVADLIKEYSKKAQVIMVSHNDAIISKADQLYGVSMKDGVSSIVSLQV